MFLLVHSHGVLASGDRHLADSCFCFCHSCSPFALPFLVWSSGVRGIASTFCTAANARVRRHATVTRTIAELDYRARKVVTGECDGEWDECQLLRLSGLTNSGSPFVQLEKAVTDSRELSDEARSRLLFPLRLHPPAAQISIVPAEGFTQQVRSVASIRQPLGAAEVVQQQ